VLDAELDAAVAVEEVAVPEELDKPPLPEPWPREPKKLFSTKTTPSRLRHLPSRL
jgi:hypothetical protein